MATVECVLDARPSWPRGRSGTRGARPLLGQHQGPRDPSLRPGNRQGHGSGGRRPMSGSLALRGDGGMVVALKTGFFFFDPPDNFTAIAEPEPDLPDNRFNDGKTDRQGRFWAGSLYDPDETKPTGGLFRLDADLSCHRMVDGIYRLERSRLQPRQPHDVLRRQPPADRLGLGFRCGGRRDREPPRLHRAEGRRRRAGRGGGRYRRLLLADAAAGRTRRPLRSARAASTA